mgnify:CR=1 FL=1
MASLLPFASACVLGCGVQTGVGSVLNVAKVATGESVAVIGTGGVGLSVIQGARIARAGMIVGVDVNPARLEMARRFGAAAFGVTTGVPSAADWRRQPPNRRPHRVLASLGDVLKLLD